MTSKMLPFALVLLVAHTAFAAPSVGVSTYNINSVPSVKDNGQLVSRYLTDGPFEYVDGGETSIYEQLMMTIIGDLAGTRDPASQAAAVVQTIVTLAEIANGVPGDACESAALINAYAYYASTGNSAGLRSALPSFIQRVAGNIDTITDLVINPNSVRYASGPKGNCIGGGRSYQFEAAWDGILNNANAYQIGLLNEEYCAAKRLSNASSIRSNNVGAAITAASVPQVTQVIQNSLPALANFLRVVSAGGNPANAAGQAKNALLQSIGSATY